MSERSKIKRLFYDVVELFLEHIVFRRKQVAFLSIAFGDTYTYKCFSCGGNNVKTDLKHNLFSWEHTIICKDCGVVVSAKSRFLGEAITKSNLLWQDGEARQ